jgi:tight adherence protein B
VTAAVLAALAVWCATSPPRRLPRQARERRSAVALVLVGATAAAVGLTLGALRPTVLLLIGLGVAGAFRRLWRDGRQARAAAVTRDRVLECCDLLAVELASGRPPGSALVQASEVWPALAPVASTQTLGGDVVGAMRRLSTEPGAEGLRLVAAAWRVSHRTGRGLADALARVADGLRAARAADRVVQGELASARATARLVAALPLLTLAMATGNGGEPVTFLIGSPIGLGCLAGGLALGFTGLAWIDRIARDVHR